MKMIDHNHFICHLILGTFTEYPYNSLSGYIRRNCPDAKQKHEELVRKEMK